MPNRIEGYPQSAYAAARAGLLHLATVLGDVMEHATVIGGLVPGLLIDARADVPPSDPHVGTTDVDIGLALAVLDQDRYRELAHRMRDAGFQPDTNENGNPTSQRWVLGSVPRVTVDFLIPTTTTPSDGGRIHHLEPDFGAVVTPGLLDATRTRVPIQVVGRTLVGERVTRTIHVCGPAGFVILKALAFGSRGAPKDAYDLVYVLANHPHGSRHIGADLVRLRNDEPIEPDVLDDAVATLTSEFREIDSTGPRRTAAFLSAEGDDAIRADAVAHVGELLRAYRAPNPLEAE